MSKRELTQEEKIRRENLRLRRRYRSLPKDILAIVDGLIDRAAWLRVVLNDMELDMLENGTTEPFTQSANVEPYERERPIVRQYNSMTRNYQSIIRQLDAKLPEAAEAVPNNPLVDFLLDDPRRVRPK